jgi:hypothetical protein
MTTDNFCFYLQYRLVQTSQTGGQWYSDTSPFCIPWSTYRLQKILGVRRYSRVLLVSRDGYELPRTPTNFWDTGAPKESNGL